MDRVFFVLAGLLVWILSEQPCQPLENPAHPSSFTWINPSWLVAAVSEKLSGCILLPLLHFLPQALPADQHLPLLLPKSLTSGSLSWSQSPVLPRLMVRYSLWRQLLGVIFMAPNFLHSIFDLSCCTGTQWIVDKVMLEHSLHFVLICDIHTAIFPLNCSRASVCPCTLFRVRCRPYSEGCE